jgi:hypothetical protein
MQAHQFHAQELRNIISNITLGKPVSVIGRRRQSVVKLHQLKMLDSNLAVLPIQYRRCPQVFKTGRQTLQINCRYSLCQSSGLAVVFASCSACFSLIVVGERMR